MGGSGHGAASVATVKVRGVDQSVGDLPLAGQARAPAPGAGCDRL